MTSSSRRPRDTHAAALSIPALPAAILTATLGLGLALAVATLAAPAKAYDDDVDVVCWDRDDGETECETVENLAAECEVADPEYTTEQCQGLLESRRPFGLTTTTTDRTEDKTRRDDNGGKGNREPNRGGDSGGNSGGSGGTPNG